MDLSEVLALYDKEQRREIEFPGMRRDVLPNLVRYVRPMPGMSFVLYSDLDEANVDATIDEQLAYFRREGLQFEWKVYAHDRPADLADRLIAQGFEPEEEAASIMVLDVPASPPSLLIRLNHDVRRLTDPGQLGDVIAILEASDGDDYNWIYDRLGSHMNLPDYLSVYVAYADDRPVSSGWIYFSPGHFASLWGGATLAAYRGRGFYTAVLSARVQEARQRGVRYLTIDAGSMSRPIVARHGFQEITQAIGCEWRPAMADNK
jgi:GNAT superfamily N-acetyltransferase